MYNTKQLNWLKPDKPRVILASIEMIKGHSLFISLEYAGHKEIPSN